MELLKKANKLFQNRDYGKAKDLYQEALKKYNYQYLDLNIELCDKRLKLTNINNYFDNVYVVNLKHQVSDKLKVANHLEKYNINFEIFEATNGYVGEPLKRWDEYKKKPLGMLKRFPHYSEKEKNDEQLFIESAGAMGYIYTYIQVLKDAKKNGYQRFLILEDDIILDKNFNQKFKKFIDSIDDDWKVLHLGASQYGWNSVDIKAAADKGHYVARAMDTKGSYAMAFDLSVVDEVIEEQSAFEAPFDHIPMGEIYERHLGKCFVSFPYIVMPDVGESTIRGKRCQYTHSKRMKWNIENYDYPLNKPSIAIIINSKANLNYLDNFTSIKNLPFTLALFFNSNDGLRPLHNKELLDLDYNTILPIDHLSIQNEYDYIASIDEGVLTEADIIKFIEYKTNIKKLNTTHLSEIVTIRKKIVTNRASVIVPTYKRSKNLFIALESVVKQDYPDIELIVISDNGKDSKYNVETKEIIDRLKDINPNCRIILLEHDVNRNGSAARNTGILHSTGEFISFLDDDDMYLPGRLSKTIAVLKKQRKNIGAVYCGFLGWNSPVNDLNRYQVGDLTLEILQLEYKKHYLHTNTATYRREVILNMNGFDESYRRHQDLEFNLRFFEQYEIAACKEALVQLNPEPSGVSNKAFNTVMLDLKFKFLTQFQGLIENYSEEAQYKIYDLHQNEALKYVKEKDKALDFYKINFKDYHVQMLMKLAYSINPKNMKVLDASSMYQKNEMGFYRILGNNMPFLQSDEQSFENVVKIVEEESNFKSSDKHFVINRMINEELKEKIISYLKEKEVSYLEIPFKSEDFKKIGYAFKNVPDASVWFSNLNEWNRLVIQTEIRESKNRYLMNNNGARNFSLQHGKKLYRWTMPWDGNCFMADADYKVLEEKFRNSGKYKYIVTPMDRASSNADVNKNTASTNAIEEPQISFRYDAIEAFNEQRVYGNQPKVEFFKQIGLEGKWDEWNMLSPWMKLTYNRSTELNLVSSASAVFRLASGNQGATIKASNRNNVRKRGICDYIDQAEIKYIKENFESIKYNVEFSSLFKKVITNQKLKVYNDKLIWAYKQKEMTEKIMNDARKIIAKVLTVFNGSDNSSKMLYASIILFSHNLMNDSKIVFNEDTQLFIDGKFKTVYDRSDLTDMNVLKSTVSNTFTAMLFQLTQQKFMDVVKLKVELSMLLYYYFSKKVKLNFEEDEDIKGMIAVIDIVFKEIFEYDIIKNIDE